MKYYYYTIEDKFGSNLVPRREKDKNEKEYIAVDVPVAVSDQFFAWVFSMKNKVQIVAPINVKKQMHDMVRYVGTRYGLWL